jgi:chromosomal replication initiator protein
MWEQVKTHVRGKLSENSYSLWINPISLLDERDDSLVLGCPNKFSMNWIMEHYMSLMQEKLDTMGQKS